MMSFDSCRAVIIYAKINDEEEKAIGSGVEFCPGHILTVKHNLEENSKPCSAIQIGWWLGKGKKPHLSSISEEGNIWRDSCLDLAIISIEDRPNSEEFKFDHSGICPILHNSPQELYGWGFPHISDQNREPYLCEIRGRGQLNGKDNEYHISEFNTDASKHPMSITEANAGSSGSGLFINSRLAAVVTSVKADPPTMFALSLAAAIRESSEFRTALFNVLGRCSTPLDSDIDEVFHSFYSEEIDALFMDQLRNAKNRCDELQVIKDCLNLIYNRLKSETLGENYVLKCHNFSKLLVSSYLLTQGDLLKRDEGNSKIPIFSSKLAVAEFVMGACDSRVLAYGDITDSDPSGKFRLNAGPAKSFSKAEKNDFLNVRRLLCIDHSYLLDSRSNKGGVAEDVENDVQNPMALRNQVLDDLRDRADMGLPRLYITVNSTILTNERVEAAVTELDRLYDGLVPIVVLELDDGSWGRFNSLVPKLRRVLNAGISDNAGPAQ